MSSRLGRELFKLRSQTLAESIHLSGLNASGRAYAAAALYCEIKSSNAANRLLVICSTPDEATVFHQSVKTFLGLLAGGKTYNPSLIEYLPGWEVSPYRGINPNVKAKFRRMKALYRIAMGESDFVITDARGAAQLNPNLERIVAGALNLAKGDFIERGELRKSLEELGYHHADPVEDPGSYCFRGNLLDIFSPLYTQPIRAEFLGDEIETLRFFDPNTQRSKDALTSAATFLPTSLFSTSKEANALATSRIKEFADQHDIPKKLRDELTEKINAGIKDPNFDYLHPFFSSDLPVALSEYLKFSAKPWDIIIADEVGVQSALDRLNEELKVGFENALKEQLIACEPGLIYDRNILERLKVQQNGLFLNAFQLGVTPKAEEEPETELNAPQKVVALSSRTHLKLRENGDLRSPGATHSIDIFLEKNKSWYDRGYRRVIIASSKTQAERIDYLLQQKGLSTNLLSDSIDFNNVKDVQITVGNLAAGFRLAFDDIAIINDSELFGPKKQRTTGSAAKQKASQPENALAAFIPSLEEIRPGELLVHQNHGIGRYQGLVKLEVEKIPQDFLLVEYAGNDKLYLPIYRLELVQRYIGDSDSSTLALDRLGGSQFEKTKSKVREALKELAHELLRIYAIRSTHEGFKFSPPDEGFKEFEASFPFAETPDQMRAIDQTLSDMQSGKVMDRLICGDVGYGKTEVAMRAAYKAVLDGKQVAILVPTTVLALQHELSFKNRFKETGVRITSISRFKDNKEIKQTLNDATNGRLDILIGTHRLLSRDVKFKDLGLIIVDEEQRFGVEHKEKLKKLKLTTAILTLTATPIPRTLHMSLMGLRDISIINTAPIDRLSVRTYISRFDENAIRTAITQEIERGGQVFFIHNRVQSIGAMEERIKKIVPKARIVVAHGQLKEGELEEKMLEFYNKKADVLLCTTIIESGLDIPSANTLIVNRADMFGLAQLYQLRGRVGRSQLRAYCYLLLPEEGLVTDDARKRLEVIQRFVDLGSGFKIASHDLELRGGGDILGKAQSGHIAAVGYELFSDLLNEAIHEVKGEEFEERFDPEIKIPVAALLPDDYVPDIQQRLGLYKRISQAATLDEISDLEMELRERFGKPPESVLNLLDLILIKQLLVRFHIKTLLVGPDRVSLDASEARDFSPEKILNVVKQRPKQLAITPESKIILNSPFKNLKTLHGELRQLFDSISS